MESGSNGSALAAIEPVGNSLEANVGTLMRRATDVAGVCRDVVTKTAQVISGRKHVRVEGWQSIAVAYGCVLSARDVEAVAGGIRAIGEVRRMSDGAVVSTGEGFVGDDEKTWASRPLYARRAMAQTRAMSRAGRSAFSFVVTLIDSGFSTTPAEEMDGVTQGSETPPPPAPVKRGVAPLRETLRPTPPPVARTDGPPPHADADFRADVPHDTATGEVRQALHDRSLAFKFGRDKGKPLSELEEGSLKWFESKLLADLDDASKSRWHEQTRQQLTTLRAELAYRGL